MKTRVVPTKVHAVLDYVSAPALIAAPEVFRLNGSRASALAPRIAGAGAAAYSAMTDYELGIRRVLPMRAHLALDALSGGLLAAVPWVSGSARRGARHWLPHAAVGATEVALALITKTAPEPEPSRFRRAASAVGPATRSPVVIGFAVVSAGALAYFGRRRMLQGVAEAADALEEVADAVEDAAEDLADAARERAEPKDV